MALQKLKDGIIMGAGFVLVIGVSSMAYAAFTWVVQTDVQTGYTLTAAGWNDMFK